MGFSLKKFIGGAAQVLAPALGGVLGGPLGAAVGSAVGGAFSEAPGARLALTAAANGGGATTPAMGTTGALVVAGATRVAQIMTKIATHLGKRVPVKRVIDFIRKWGPTAAAAALGITANEALELWLARGDRPRARARGVSAADIRRTTRVLGTLDRMGDRVRKFCRPSAFGPRRSAPTRRRASRK